MENNTKPDNRALTTLTNGQKDLTHDGVNPLIIVHVENGVVAQVVTPSGRQIAVLLVDLDAPEDGLEADQRAWPPAITVQEYAAENLDAWPGIVSMILAEGGTVPEELAQ